jgi:hypothetical protein
MDSPNDDDPIVAEVRRVREEIAAECSYDYDRIVEYCQQQAKQIRERMAERRRTQAEEEAARAPSSPRAQ